MKFLGAKKQNFKEAKAIILPVAYQRTVSYMKGTSKGPQAILDASESLDEYDEELDKIFDERLVFTLPILKLDSKKPKEAVFIVKQKVLKILKEGKLPIILGGEHSITFGATSAFNKMGFDFSVLWLDAHLDLRDTWHKSKFNHACPARRTLELGIPVTWVGIRTVGSEEIEFVRSQKLENRIFYAPNIPIKKIISTLKQNVYISLDFDVFDPAIMPSVGTPQPGGLGWYEILQLIKEVAKKRKIIGADFMELAPFKNFVAPDVLAAKLVYKIINYMYN